MNAKTKGIGINTIDYDANTISALQQDTRKSLDFVSSSAESLGLIMNGGNPIDYRFSTSC